MSLSDYKFKRTYDPCVDGDELLNNFYLPCLSTSIRYDRISAYFSSAVLKQFGEGLADFYKNGGKIRFIFSSQITDEELKNIKYGYQLKMKVLADSLSKFTSTSPVNIEYDFDVANLSYLIAIGVIDVKIAFMLQNRSALMHTKAGLFEDENGNKVYFEGSGNETTAGILRNAERIHVFSSNDGDGEDIADGEKLIEGMWNNTYSPNSVYATSPTGELFEKLISYNRGRIFNSASELYEYENCVLIDVNQNRGWTILVDYTDKSYLEMPPVLKTHFKNLWFQDKKHEYHISKLTPHIINDKIVSSLKSFNIKYVFTTGTLLYLDKYSLELERRTKLSLSIKEHKNEDLWMTHYLDFKRVVDRETLIPLRSQQMENAYFHYALKSSADFSVPGTGKTYISYGLYAYLTSNEGKRSEVNHIVVFGPLNCFRAWIDEGKAIFGNKKIFTIFNIKEHQNDYEKDLKNSYYSLYLFNYEFLNDFEKIKLINEFVLDGKALVIFDEIHRLKALDGYQAGMFLRLFDECRRKPIYKLALTGTPIPNSYEDIYNCLMLLFEDDMYGVFNNISPRVLKIANSNKDVEDEVRKSLQSIFIRITKKDLEIPAADPDDITSLAVQPTSDEQKLYTYIWMSYRNPLVKFIRLIQASSYPKLLADKIDLNALISCYSPSDEYDIATLTNELENDDDYVAYAKEILDLANKIEESSKMKATITLIRKLVESHQKVLVWCLFVKTIDYLKERLEEFGIDVETISGRDDVSTRDDKISRFKNTDCQVLITNPNTLAESISLHKVCHNAIYLEYGFNLTYLLQSKDRIHRVGLTKDDKTHYYFAITSKSPQHPVSDGDMKTTIWGSLDEDIYERLMIKAKRMIETIESHELIHVDSSSDREDILYILSKYE